MAQTKKPSVRGVCFFHSVHRQVLNCVFTDDLSSCQVFFKQNPFHMYPLKEMLLKTLNELFFRSPMNLTDILFLEKLNKLC